MIRKQQNGLEWLEFELLSEIPHLVHGVLLRKEDGCLNFSRAVGDSEVEGNFDLVKKTFSLPILFSSYLSHGNEVLFFDLQMLKIRPTCDGITTDQKGIGLFNTHADCQVAIFYDPIQQAIANVHSGWRGSVKNIYAETIKHMKARYRSKVENLLVCISPSLGPESAEFIHYRQELPREFWAFQVKENYFDFWAISEWQLLQEGVLSSHIQMAKIDTFSVSADYFSYRRDKTKKRQGTFVCLC